MGEDAKPVEAAPLVRAFVDALDNAFGKHDISDLVTIYKEKHSGDEPGNRATNARAFHDALIYSLRAGKKSETSDLLSDYFDSEIQAVEMMLKDKAKDPTPENEATEA